MSRVFRRTLIFKVYLNTSEKHASCAISMRIETLLKILEFCSQLTFRVMDHYAGKYKNSIFHTLVELHK